MDLAPVKVTLEDEDAEQQRPNEGRDSDWIEMTIWEGSNRGRCPNCRVVLKIVEVEEVRPKKSKGRSSCKEDKPSSSNEDSSNNLPGTSSRKSEGASGSSRKKTSRCEASTDQHKTTPTGRCHSCNLKIEVVEKRRPFLKRRSFLKRKSKAISSSKDEKPSTWQERKRGWLAGWHDLKQPLSKNLKTSVCKERPPRPQRPKAKKVTWGRIKSVLKTTLFAWCLVSQATALTVWPTSLSAKATASFEKVKAVCPIEGMAHLHMDLEPYKLVNRADAVYTNAGNMVKTLGGASWQIREAAKELHYTATRAKDKANQLDIELSGLAESNGIQERGVFADAAFAIGDLFTLGGLSTLKSEIGVIAKEVTSNARAFLQAKEGFHELTNASRTMAKEITHDRRDAAKMLKLSKFTHEADLLTITLSDTVTGIDLLDSGKLSPLLINPSELKAGLDLIAEDAHKAGMRMLIRSVTEAYHLPVSVVKTPTSNNIRVFIHIPLSRTEERWEMFYFRPATTWLADKAVTFIPDERYLGIRNEQAIIMTSEEWNQCTPTLK